MKTPTYTTRSLAVAACLAATTLAACGDGGESNKQTGTAAGGADVGARGGQAMIDAQAALAKCIRRQGIDLPDPKADGGFEFDAGKQGVDEARLRVAERRCARYRRAVSEAAPRPSASEQQETRDQLLRFARCMRAQGADVPDPSAGGEGEGMAVEVPGDAKSDPTFQRATRKCERLLRGS